MDAILIGGLGMMKNFRTLLTAQLVSATLLVIVLLVGFLYYGKNLLILEENTAKLAIEQTIATHVTADGKSLSRQLDRSFKLKSLQVRRLDGTILYEQSNNAYQTSFISQLLALAGKADDTVTIKDEQQDVLVRYELDHRATLKGMQYFLFVLVASPFILFMLPVLIIKNSLQRKYRRISRVVNETIEAFLSDNKQTKAENSQLPAEFSEISISLRKLAQYTSQQAEKMKADAQLIAEEAYKDTVTGLPNRNRFVQNYEEHFNNTSQANYGIFGITRCTELQSINQTRGFHEGDQYIKEVAEILKRVIATYRDSKLFRLNGSDFGILMPKVTPKEAENFALQLQSRFNEFQKLSELDSVAYTGLVSYENGKALGELLASADTAISLAQTKQPNAWHLQKESSGLDSAGNSYGNQNWRNVIDDVIANNRLVLLVQHIMPSSRAAKAYSEILVRFKTHEEQTLPTASFLAMAEKLDKIIAIDRLIVETSLTMIKTKSMHDQYFGINLSPRSVHDDQFVIWLERRLLKDANIAAKLVFEVSEFGLQQNLKTSKRFIDMLHRAGSRITVEKFGVGITSFKFFRDLKPDYVKMDGSYTRHINEDKNNQYFMRLMIDLAHRIGVGVFAESVETQEEKHMLESLFIDGNQGYYIGKPSPM
ncbi:EAL domain-containing protein [Rheinheimera sp. UJ63]|nr:EAL domain-containing protein [Rheinheimera sp. UJ63]